MSGRSVDNSRTRQLIAKVLQRIPADDEAPAPISQICRDAGLEVDAASATGATLAAVLGAFGSVQVSHVDVAGAPMLRATSRTGTLFLASLARYLHDGTPVLTNWSRAGTGDPPYGPSQAVSASQFLYMMEQRRLRADPNAAPLRNVRVAQVVVKARFHTLGERYLVLYDGRARQYQLPGGYRRDDDPSLRDTAIRELDEELLQFAFDPAQDSLHELGRVEIVQQSYTYGVVTRYEITFFQLHTIRWPIRLAPGSRWIRARQLLAANPSSGGLSINATGVRRLHHNLAGGLGRLAVGVRPSMFGSVSVIARERKWELIGVVLALAGIAASVVLSL